ncbi:MAG: M15 family metallopeptidase, partial [Clostridia bacterium]|nr:M15 family metallopeptidase [Clostridia bacterium]
KATGEVTNVTVTSAYRSYDYQDYLFKTYFDRDWASGRFKTKEECEKYTLSYSTKPGTSEHQSGLCLDMHNLPSAEESFKYKPEAKWLAENCYRFGFILRYPEGKTDITKITYEPWHFRFVGRDAATEMHELGLTLDEYVPLKKSEIDANK